MVDDGNGKDRANKPGKKVEKMTSVASKPEVSDLIARRLRNYYDAVAEQPVPDRFLDLLNQLEAASTPKKPD
jgi:ubiquitin